MKVTDFFQRINREGFTCIDLGLFLFLSSGLWLLLVYIFSLEIYPTEPVFFRSTYVQESTGVLEAIFIWGIILLLLGLYFRAKRTILYQEKWHFTLYLQRGSLYLSVLKGGSALYEKVLPLSKEERRRYWKEGIPYIQSLVKKV